MLKRAFMAATVLLLLTLVVVTPRLIGPEQGISTLPRLILNYDQGILIAFVTSLSGTYLYEALYLNITPLGMDPIRNDTSRAHSLEMKIPLDHMVSFRLEAVAQDRQGTFFDAMVNARPGSEGWSFQLVFRDPNASPREITRDILSGPFVTFMQRRVVA